MSRHWNAAAVFALCTTYAIVRYTILGPVSYEQLPLYVVNKGASFAGLILLVWAGGQRDPLSRRLLGVQAFALIALHVVLSLMLLTPGYFPKFFQSTGLMTWQSEASMLTGAIGFLMMCRLLIASESQEEQPVRRGSLLPGVGRTVMMLAALHVALMGYQGWLTPEKWFGGMPPITLLSFLAALLPFVWRRRNGEQSRGAEDNSIN
ncbi:MAG: hypothetical protein AB7K24_28595 [Gemmataceae bacterium]